MPHVQPNLVSRRVLFYLCIVRKITFFRIIYLEFLVKHGQVSSIRTNHLQQVSKVGKNTNVILLQQCHVFSPVFMVGVWQKWTLPPRANLFQKSISFFVFSIFTFNSKSVTLFHFASHKALSCWVETSVMNGFATPAKNNVHIIVFSHYTTSIWDGIGFMALLWYPIKLFQNNIYHQYAQNFKNLLALFSQFTLPNSFHFNSKRMRIPTQSLPNASVRHV